MREYKCFWCKNKAPSDELVIEETRTGKFNKNGTEKLLTKRFHHGCMKAYVEDKLFKENEAKELEVLYEYLKELHDIGALDGRMMEKIQDFRNGTIKVGNRKIKKYKNGISYKQMYQTYIYIEKKLINIRQYKNFETKWNEFAYFFGTMVNNVIEVDSILKTKTKQEEKHEAVIKKNIPLQDHQEININKNKKKDTLDISDFL